MIIDKKLYIGIKQKKSELHNLVKKMKHNEEKCTVENIAKVEQLKKELQELERKSI